MKAILNHFRSSVGKKQIVGLTGLLVGGFALTHMLGNMLILVGPEAYNKYGHALVSNPLLPLAEVGLAAAFLAHIFVTLQLVLANRRAREVSAYRAPNVTGKRAKFASRTMALSGLLMLAFLVLHLITFKYGAHYTAVYGGVEMRDLHRLVIEKFNEPLYFAWYFLCLVILGAHLSHGFAATMQSLGVQSVRNPFLKKLGWFFAILISAGFISQPIYAVLVAGR